MRPIFKVQAALWQYTVTAAPQLLTVRNDTRYPPVAQGAVSAWTRSSQRRTCLPVATTKHTLSFHTYTRRPALKAP